MRRVLIISPHFPPVNAPDMQRIRQALPHLRNLGWEPIVLAVRPDRIEGAVLEPILEKTYPSDIQIHRVGGIPPHLTRKFKIGSLWWRCGRSLRKAGTQLLRMQKVDLIFFSTTLFNSFTLGPIWKRRFGVPYVLDYQDPWINDHYRRTGQQPPGGPLRFGLSQLLARMHEPEVIRSAAGVVSVSPTYLSDLERRYPDFRNGAGAVIPFASSQADFAIAKDHPPIKSIIPFGDGRKHLVYTGRGGADMARTVRILFSAYRRYLESNGHPCVQSLHFHFIGTDYAPAGLAKPTILPVAKEEGVAQHVSEHCLRIPYFEALHYLSRADTIMILGSDDPGYNASKLHTCLLAGRPVLCIGHESSPLIAAARQHANTAVFSFGGQKTDADCAATICRHYFEQHCHAQHLPTLVSDTIPDALAMSRRLTEYFDRALHPTITNGRRDNPPYRKSALPS